MRNTPWGAVQSTSGTPSSMRSEPAVVPRRFLAITAAMALILSLMAVNAMPAFGGPGGNDEQGHVKIHDGPTDSDPEVKNEPKVCDFHVHGFNFHADEGIVWEIRAKGEHGWQDGAVVKTGGSTADSEGEWRDPDAGAYEDLPDGHYKLFVDRVDRPGGPMKHKVFKVECGEEEVAAVVATTTTTTAPTTTTTAAPTTTTAGQGEGATDVLGSTITAPTTTAPGADAEAGAVTDEVLSAQVEAEQLPFTGIETDRLIGLAILLLGGGVLLLRGTARREES